MSYHNNNLYVQNQNIGGAVTPIPYSSTKSLKQNPTSSANKIIKNRHQSHHTVRAGSLDRKETIFSKNAGRNPRLSNKGREEVVVKGEIFKGIQHNISRKEQKENVLKQKFATLNKNNGLKNHNENRRKSPVRKRALINKNSGMKATHGNNK